MSLLGTIGKKLTTSFYKVADPILTTFAHPIQVTKAIVSPKTTVKQVQEEFFSQPKSSQIAQTVLAGVNYGIAGASGASLAAKGVVSAAKAVTVKKVASLVGFETVAQVVSKSPKAQDIILNAPNNINNFTSNVATAIETPTLESGLRIIRENPFLSGTALIALLGSMGFSASLIATLMNTRAINENSEIKEDRDEKIIPTQKTENPNANNPVINIINQLPPTVPAITSPIPAVAASTTTAPAGSTPKKKKKKAKKKAKKKPKKKKKTRRSKKKSIKRRKSK